MDWLEKIKNKVKSFISSHSEEITSGGAKFDAKVAAERKQYQELGGIGGEYFAQNAISLLSRAAEGIGKSEWREFFEKHREDVAKIGRSFDGKVAEEVKQYKGIGNAGGEYLAKNLISFLSQASEKLGNSDWKEFFESHRGDVETIGQSVDKKLAEEYKQYQTTGGIGGKYFAQNAISLLSQISHKIGKDSWKEFFEAHRGDVEAIGKSVDLKAAQELQQFKSMDGAGGEYLAQNIISLLSQASEKAGKSDWKEFFEAHCGDVKGFGKDVDSEIKKQWLVYNQSKGVGEYVALVLTNFAAEDNNKSLFGDIRGQSGALPQNPKSDSQSIRFDKRLEGKAATDKKQDEDKKAAPQVKVANNGQNFAVSRDDVRS